LALVSPWNKQKIYFILFMSITKWQNLSV